MGAGVIPFAVHKQQVYFLFQTVFSGRKSGFLIDFGGGINAGESHQQAAAREWVEETETMFFARNNDELRLAKKTPARITEQLSIVSKLFTHTLLQHPDWYCRRAPGNKIPPKDWTTFFVEVEYQDLDSINQQWKIENGRQTRFSKRRELHWLDADSLLLIYKHHSERLWKRVRQLENAELIIQSIKQEKGVASIS